jgi:hypothetical protein
MQDFKKTKTKLVEAVAVARDEALVKVGKDAEIRQDQRASKLTQRKAGKAAMALIAAAGALTAGAIAVKAMARKNVLEGKPASTN